MLDFTSALYLGMRHASAELRPWSQLTTGRPATLHPEPDADIIANRLAALQGCERGVLAPSTLHLFWDVFGLVDRQHVTMYVDAGVYPIARWGVERAAAHGVQVRRFPHHDSVALWSQVQGDRRQGRAPLVVTDGFCPNCSRVAPLADYLEIVRNRSGRLVIDDTQALGVFGAGATPSAPYGVDGGGSLCWSGVSGREIVVIASLAKGFGVPVAALTGSHAVIDDFEQRSATRVHCSPPSFALIRAVEHAMALNEAQGDALRAQLAERVYSFRQRLAAIGFRAGSGLFPVQTITASSSIDTASLYKQLHDAGIRTVLHRGRNGDGARLSFIITARHRPAEIDRGVAVLAAVVGGEMRRQSCWR